MIVRELCPWLLQILKGRARDVQAKAGIGPQLSIWVKAGCSDTSLKEMTHSLIMFVNILVFDKLS